MSITVVGEIAETTKQSRRLRFELKEWEKSFAAANGGRKAGRDDIKKHPDIASKYKAYNTLTNRISPSQTSSPNPAQPTYPKKRKHSPFWTPSASAQTPPKRPQFQHPLHPSALDPYDFPLSVHRSPDLLRTFIGPTPQKNGKVLGLFDLLSPSSAHKNALTPSKRTSLHPVVPNEQTTPSKGTRFDTAGSGVDTTKGDNGGEPQSGGGRPKRTPQSSSKRTWLDSFLTPSARRVSDRNEERTPGSRGSVSKLKFDETPEFLRRGSQRFAMAVGRAGADGGVDQDLGEEEISWSPITVRMPGKPAGRGLSALMKGLRSLEEEVLDDEMDILRELEGEDAGGLTKSRTAKVLVKDSQMEEMPLGPDGEGEEENEDEDLSREGIGRDGRPLKVWKKKGQKRTTRRVVMKPVTEKWKPEPEWKGPRDNDDDDSVVADTQLADGVVGEDGDENEEGLAGRANHGAEAPAKIGKADGLVDVTTKSKKAPKKISSTAHANYRALKIKNKHSKGKGGGRFARRR